MLKSNERIRKIVYCAAAYGGKQIKQQNAQFANNEAPSHDLNKSKSAKTATDFFKSIFRFSKMANYDLNMIRKHYK